MFGMSVCPPLDAASGGFARNVAKPFILRVTVPCQSRALPMNLSA
jgi:hypothetical protein